MVKIAVVADDFTGANDCCGRFADFGFTTWAAIDFAPPPKPVQVEAIHSRTRFEEPGEARKRSARAWAVHSKRGLAGRWRFQKIDSTLRGWPGQEILGLLQSTGEKFVSVCAAYPEHGRTTRGGIHLVRGQELLKTEYAKDLVSPARVNRPKAMFPDALAVEVPLKRVRASRESLKNWILSKVSIGVRIFCFDAMDDADLRRAVAGSFAAGGRAFAGASGLAKALAMELGGVERKEFRRPTGVPRKGLALVGSISEISFDQLHRARREGYLWDAINWPGKKLSPGSRMRDWLAALKQQGGFCLSSLEQRPHTGIRGAKKKSDWNLFRLATLARLMGRDLSCLLTGGHMAEVFFEVNLLEGNFVFGEIQKGLPLALASGPGGEAWITSKPGGFGDDKTIVNFFEWLLEGKRG